MKVVINTCYGGFGLSEDAVNLYEKLGGAAPISRTEIHGKTYFGYYEIQRNDPVLVQVVEKLGTKANDIYAELTIVEIPDDVNWYVAEYDGNEWVAEGRTWP
jgi:hypothetical protein